MRIVIKISNLVIIVGRNILNMIKINLIILYKIIFGNMFKLLMIKLIMLLMLFINNFKNIWFKMYPKIFKFRKFKKKRKANIWKNVNNRLIVKKIRLNGNKLLFKKKIVKINVKIFLKI
jgi:hypothetical protein